MREKVGKSFTVFFQWFVAPEGRKVGSLKRRVRSQLVRGEMKNCTPLWREAHFQVKMHKAHHVRTTFGSWDVEKVHAVVARSTFPSQNAQNTPGADYFWHLRCPKSARHCDAKRISKSKCTKHTRCGPLLEVEMSKKCTPLWREARFQVKMYKTHQVRTTFGSWDVEKVNAVVARSRFPSQNVKTTRGSEHFWRFRCRFAWQAQGIVHLVKSEEKSEGFVAFSTTTTTTPHYTPIHYTQLHSITLHYTTLHYTTLHYITLRYLPLHYITLHYITLHYTTLHYTMHYLPLHFTTLHYTTLHNTTTTTTQLHSTALHYTPQH